MLDLGQFLQRSDLVVASKFVSTSQVCARLVDVHRNEPVAGELLSHKFHYIDWRLSQRPPTSKGCFADWSEDRETVGEILLVPAGCRLRAEGGAGAQQILNVLLPARPLFEDEQVCGEEFGRALRECLHLNNSTVRHSLEVIRKEITDPGFASDLSIEAAALTMFVALARLMQDRAAAATWKGGLAPWRMRLIESRVRDGDVLPTLAELADICGLSRRQLMRAFRQQTGQTVWSYVQHYAIERAKALLIEGDRPIGVLAVQSGFSSNATFSAAFRRATGLPPSVYRRKLRT
jgi:AraC family transcriptional regulator